jgi:hypothetical protein
MKTTDYVEALRFKLGARSYYHLSQLIGMPESQLARYRKGGTFDNSMCIRVAQWLEIEPLTVIADMEMERAKDTKARELWANLIQKAAATAVCAGTLGLVGVTGLTPSPAQANDLTAYKFTTIY